MLNGLAVSRFYNTTVHVLLQVLLRDGKHTLIAVSAARNSACPSNSFRYANEAYVSALQMFATTRHASNGKRFAHFASNND